MNLALVFALMHATFAFANITPNETNVPAKSTRSGRALEVVGAIVETSDGSLCNLDVAGRPDLVPPFVSIAATAAPLDSHMEPCGPRVVEDVRRTIGSATIDPRVAVLPAAAAIPAVCLLSAGAGVFSGIESLNTPPGQPRNGLASMERGFFAGLGAGAILPMKSGVAAAVAPGLLAVVGMTCAAATELGTYYVYFFFKPMPKAN